MTNISVNNQTPNNKNIRSFTIRLPYEPGDFIVPREQLLKVPPTEDADYEAGDLVWVKFQAYPWWPCMVTVDPYTGKYSKREQLPDGTERIDYHIQYFGPKAYRSYTTGQIFLYEGKEKYETHLDNIKNTPVSDRAARQRELAKYSIKPSQKKNWSVAADQADLAIPMSNAERISKLTFEYELVTRYGGKIKVKPERSASPSTPARKPRGRSLSNTFRDADETFTPTPSAVQRPNKSQTAPPKRNRGRPKSVTNLKRKSLSKSDVYDFDEFDDELNESTPTKPLLLFSAKRANRGEFNVYAARNRSKIEEEHPTLDDEAINSILQKKWDLLADDQRNLYVNRSASSPKSNQLIDKSSLDNNLEFSDTEESNQPVVKRGRGRPRRTDSIGTASSSKRKLSVEKSEPQLKKQRLLHVESPSNSDSLPTPARKSRGRPRKSDANLNKIKSENSETKSARTSTRGRRSTLVLDESYSENQTNILNKSGKENLDENKAESFVDEDSLKEEDEWNEKEPKKDVEDEKSNNDLEIEMKSFDESKNDAPIVEAEKLKEDKAAEDKEEEENEADDEEDEDEDDADMVNDENADKDDHDDDEDENGNSDSNNDCTKDDVEFSADENGKDSSDKPNEEEPEEGGKSTENETKSSSSKKATKRRKVKVLTLKTRVRGKASKLKLDYSSKSDIQMNCCGKCFKLTNDSLLACQGSCLRSFHPKCMSFLDSENSVQMCYECKTNEFNCFVCKKHTPDVRKCTDSKCPKYYHMDCIKQNYPLRNDKDQGFRCPLHFCLTCYGQHQDDKVFRHINKKMFTCVRCPTAYHRLSSCVAAGSLQISKEHIICPEHNFSRRKHSNVSWCFSCNMGGNLVCCESCPTAFHADCLEYKLPDGEFFCSGCLKRNQLLYSDIVWVKFGAFRWWPGIIKHPNTVPQNIQSLEHGIGDFPVFFFGSHDYHWINRGRAFLYMEGDEERRISCRNSMDKIFKLAMEEAVVEFQRCKEEKKNDLCKKTGKPPPYNHIKVNKPYGNFKQPHVDDTTDKEEFQHCECDENDPCGNDTNCFNRLLMYECDSKICKNGDKCKNQRFKRREYVKAVPFKTEAGWGLKALEDVKKGQFVIEYVGELIDEEECNRRLKDLVERGDSNFYFLTIDRDTIIDAGPKGNFARFMNHSCNPNCETQKWVVNNQTRVGLFAMQDIPADSELTFNYNLESRGNEKIKCLCKAQNCSGYIGVQPKKIPIVTQPKIVIKEKEEVTSGRKPGVSISSHKRRLTKEMAAVHEDECFRCGEPGKLIMCDKKYCPKSYHASCLGLDKTPGGLWICPWHHCDVCGRNAYYRCDFCPLSLCRNHEDSEKLEKLKNGYQLCYEHVNRPSARKYLLSLPEKSENQTSANSKDQATSPSKKSADDSKPNQERLDRIKNQFYNFKRKSLSTPEDRAARLMRRSQIVPTTSSRKPSKRLKKEAETDAEAESTNKSFISMDEVSNDDSAADESNSQTNKLDAKSSNSDEQLSESSEGHKENNLDNDNFEVVSSFDLIAPKQKLIEDTASLDRIKPSTNTCDSITGDQLIKSSLIEHQIETCS